ncbi:hypothetical protein [Variovorax paradoxus]|uniref:hypothetical protein n=1 Tax=Variovorax paradoxus TaxID=34073 RepID=UPI0018852ECA|nr:hypothetical protein [Variovorax paradoxus]
MVAIVIWLIDFGNQMPTLPIAGHCLPEATGMMENPKIKGCPSRRHRSAVNSHR